MLHLQRMPGSFVVVTVIDFEFFWGGHQIPCGDSGARVSHFVDRGNPLNHHMV